MARQHTQQARRTAHRTGCGPSVQISSQRTSGLQNRQVDYHVWVAMLEAYCKLKIKPKTIAELKEALQVIWGNLPQGPIDKTVKGFSN